MKEELQSVLTFWLEEVDSEKHFKKDPAFDALISDRFGEKVERAKAGEYDELLADARLRLAVIILLDQFSRNIYRGQAEAFAGDRKALELSQTGIEAGLDQTLSKDEKHFFYMPLMHAEDSQVQKLSVEKFTELGEPKWALMHQAEIEKFSRFPGRNQALGRQSTPEEIEHLGNGGGF